MNPNQKKLLSKMKKLVIEGKRRFQTRIDRNYLDDLLEIGITIDEAWNQILSLNCNCFFFDPRANYRTKEDTLIFKKKINNIIVYIKLKIENEYDNNEEIVVCLSFHEDYKKKVNEK